MKLFLGSVLLAVLVSTSEAVASEAKLPRKHEPSGEDEILSLAQGKDDEEAKAEQEIESELSEEADKLKEQAEDEAPEVPEVVPKKPEEKTASEKSKVVEKKPAEKKPAEKTASQKAEAANAAKAKLASAKAKMAAAQARIDKLKKEQAEMEAQMNGVEDKKVDAKKDNKAVVKKADKKTDKKADKKDVKKEVKKEVKRVYYPSPFASSLIKEFEDAKIEVAEKSGEAKAAINRVQISVESLKKLEEQVFYGKKKVRDLNELKDKDVKELEKLKNILEENNQKVLKLTKMVSDQKAGIKAHEGELVTRKLKVKGTTEVVKKTQEAYDETLKEHKFLVEKLNRSMERQKKAEKLWKKLDDKVKAANAKKASAHKKYMKELKKLQKMKRNYEEAKVKLRQLDDQEKASKEAMEQKAAKSKTVMSYRSSLAVAAALSALLLQ
eukprot:TRINITY_DN1820_c0_g1_i1.p1 TRINITY_DN1820_c0_g1~~TRINITY_DN1820_c0_g1_i1.p1  ORF type:complete len:439 (-),score=174.54 TRINITY_DN1820_c0_g1_i1:98-1414(-)